MKRRTGAARRTFEVVAFPVSPMRYWRIRPEPAKPGQYRGEIIHDVWEETFAQTYTEVGELHLVLATLRERRWRQGLIVVEARS
ncbi:MAG: hypothetical protein V4579_13790 [Pseudomonadota bacterium]